MAGKSFGIEYIMDAYGCDSDKLNNIDICYDFLIEITDALKMSRQSLPTVFKTPTGPQFKNGEGITAFCGLLESSVIIHTMPTKQYLALNCFTCGSMNINIIQGLVRKYFGFDHYEQTLLERGISYGNCTN